VRFFSLALLCACGWARAQSLPDPSNGPEQSEPAVAADQIPDAGLAPKSDDQDNRDRVFYAQETERAAPLMRKFVVNVVMDQKDIWTSPFHMSRQDSTPWILVGAGTAALIATDRRSSRALPNTVDQVSISKDISNVGAVYTVLPITVGMYIAGAIAHNAKARETGVLAGEAIVDTLIDVGVLKAITRRPRPFEKNGKGTFFTGGASFPSGHAAESWALASVVAHEYNKNIIYPITAYGLASLVTLSRLSGQQHFASDIFVGSAIGWFTGRYVFKTHVDHSIHRRPGSKLYGMRPQVFPQYDQLTRTRGVILNWDLARY
jgi:membrane-associated phospholipid phosphatase